MDRSKAFHALENHAWYKKLYARLTKEDLALAESFIEEHKSSDYHKLVMAINRMGLNYKTKNVALVQDLLLAAATNCERG